MTELLGDVPIDTLAPSQCTTFDLGTLKQEPFLPSFTVEATVVAHTTVASTLKESKQGSYFNPPAHTTVASTLKEGRKGSYFKGLQMCYGYLVVQKYKISTPGRREYTVGEQNKGLLIT